VVGKNNLANKIDLGLKGRINVCLSCDEAEIKAKAKRKRTPREEIVNATYTCEKS